MSSPRSPHRGSKPCRCPPSLPGQLPGHVQPGREERFAASASPSEQPDHPVGSDRRTRSRHLRLRITCKSTELFLKMQVILNSNNGCVQRLISASNRHLDLLWLGVIGVRCRPSGGTALRAARLLVSAGKNHYISKTSGTSCAERHRLTVGCIRGLRSPGCRARRCGRTDHRTASIQ